MSSLWIYKIKCDMINNSVDIKHGMYIPTLDVVIIPIVMKNVYINVIKGI